MGYNVSMKYYVVADVHGFYTELIQALTENGFFENKEQRKLIVCGDLFDRGNEAVKVQDFIAELVRRDEVILIRGNHDDMIVDLVRVYGEGTKVPLIESLHEANGTAETVLQLTGMDWDEVDARPKVMKERMENSSLFTTILPAMIDYFETGNYIFVHGWIPCITKGPRCSIYSYEYYAKWRDADEEKWRAARWYNGMEAARQGVVEPSKTIICGHWHCSYGHSRIEGKGSQMGKEADYSPYYNEGIIAIDACTVRSHKINCIVIED